MELNNLRTDSTKESEGVWVPLDETTSIKVRYTDTVRFSRATQLKFAPYRKAAKAVTGSLIVSDEQNEQIKVDLIVEEVLVDWRGMMDRGKEVPYSVDAARAALKIKAFRDIVESAAADISNFRLQDLEEDGKN